VRETKVLFPGEIESGDILVTTPDLKEYRVLRRFPATQRVQSFRGQNSAAAIFEDAVEVAECDGKAFVLTPGLPVLVKRLRLCGKAACWKHYREAADGVYRCKEHWVIGAETEL
jgi:hypothetical protein